MKKHYKIQQIKLNKKIILHDKHFSDKSHQCYR